MITDDKISDEKLKYDLNIEAAIMSVWSSGKIDEKSYMWWKIAS